jgi:molecular chaperone HtpG
MKQDSVEEYARFWAEFGPVLKEGLVDFEAQEKERLLGLLMAPSTKSETDLVSLEQYVGHMKEGQEAIYYLTGPSKETLRQSPLLESFREQGIEVLLFSDPVDEFWLERSQTYKERPLRSVGRGSVKIGPEAEQKKTADALEEKQKEYSDLLTCLRVHLQDEIKEVRLSNRLRSSAACLVADEHDLSPRMQKLLEQLGQKPPKTKRILEVNPEHPLTRGLQTVFQKDRDDPRLKSFAELLLGQAHLGESGQLEDPSEFSKALADIMLRAVKD